MYSIYLLTNKITGKNYVGVTNNVKRRMNSHKCSTNGSYIANTIRKYGWNSFDLSIICETTDKHDAYNVLETKYIHEYKSNQKEFGYNLTEGGEGAPGYVMTEEHREKLRYERTIEHREKISQSLTGRKNPEHSERMKGRTAWNKGTGKPRNRVRKARMPEASQHLNNVQYTCKHCNKFTNKGNYSRWHGDNCKVVS